MNKFFLKTCTLIILCLNATWLEAAAKFTSVLTDDLSNAVSKVQPANLPFNSCVLNFTSPEESLCSTGKIAFALAGPYAQAGGLKNLLYIEYLIMEGVAAFARAEPTVFGPLAKYFTSETAVYNTFAKIQGELNEAGQAIGDALGTQAAAQTFVTNVITKDLPTLLNQLGIDSAEIAEITAMDRVLLPSFAPMMGEALFIGYNTVNTLASKIAPALKRAEAEVVSCSCCVPKKKK